MTPAGLKPHPLADLFPLIEGDDFDAFAADIRANGLRNPIILHDGLILDGRNRLRACKAAGVPARFEPYRGDDPLAFVLSLNLARRHLNESQRAMVAAKLANVGHGGARASGSSQDANLQLENISREKAADMLHVSARSVASAAQVIAHAQPGLLRACEQGRIAVSAAAQAAKLHPAVQTEIVQRADAGQDNVVRTVLKKGVRSAREADLGRKQRALPQKRYGVIYADPEWRFEVWSRETGLDRSADNHYPTSPAADLVARDMSSIAAEDCVCFLWTTAPMLPLGLQVLQSGGFDYCSHVIWDKDRIGTGYWFRNKHEILLIGVRGRPPAPAMGAQWPSVIFESVGAHSAKPEIFAEMIEAYFPTLPKIELNRRGPARPGWDAWGNEAEGDAGAAA